MHSKSPSSSQSSSSSHSSKSSNPSSHTPPASHLGGLGAWPSSTNQGVQLLVVKGQDFLQVEPAILALRWREKRKKVPGTFYRITSSKSMCERLRKNGQSILDSEESLEEATPGALVNRHSEVRFEGGTPLISNRYY